MCNLTDVCYEKSVEGWKIVAVDKKTQEYYSLAMGFCYNDHKEIPVVQEQQRLSAFFDPEILRPEHRGGYRNNMLGRTAIFLDEEAAMKVLHRFKRFSVARGFEIKMVKARVSEDILTGTYGSPGNESLGDVAAGRKIKFVQGDRYG